ncbi:MAG: hypothetical protein EBR30_28320, partial [Cytophagia bacterium]|nr:hypothetical protein [Cytophagia bacterium]
MNQVEIPLKLTGIGAIKKELRDLKGHKIFQTAMAGISSKDISGAFKGLISTVGTLGQTFVKFGVMLLTNPIFLLVAVITAIVAGVVIFLNKIGLLGKAFEVIMAPIRAFVEGLKDILDYLGLTDFAGEEAAANEAKRQEAALKMQQEKMAAFEREKQARINLYEAVKDKQQAEIALLESQGKSAQKLKELTSQQEIADAKRHKNYVEGFNEVSKALGIETSQKTAIINADTEIIKSQTNLNNVIKDGAEKYKEYQKARIDAARLIKDLEIGLIKDATERELKENKIKYDSAILEQNKKKKQDDAMNELRRQNEAYLLIQSLTKTQYDKDREALQIQLAERLALVKGNAEQEAKVRADYAKQSRLLEIAEAEKRREAILSLATTTNEGLNQLGQLFINDQKKLEQFQKATALVQIGIDTAKAISSLVAAAQANPFNGVSAGAAGIAQFASGIVQILTNMAKAKQLLTNPTSSPNAGGGGLSGGGSATATAQATPAVNLFGQGNQLNQVGAPTSVETNQNITV